MNFLCTDNYWFGPPSYGVFNFEFQGQDNEVQRLEIQVLIQDF